MENNVTLRTVTFTTKHIWFISLSVMFLTTMCALVGSMSVWITTPIVLLGTIFIPGFLLSVLIGIKNNSVSERILYTTGLGLSFLIIGGFIINWLLPLVGILKPLAITPLLFFLNVSALVLLLLVEYFYKNLIYTWQYSFPNKTNASLGIIPLIFPFISAYGAMMLNNQNNSNISLYLLIGMALYCLVLITRKTQIKSWVYVSALYCMSLALLFMYSLRSMHIFGWDINLEYRIFQATLTHLRWSMDYYPGGDYNACMSITLLPTILKQLTHMPSEYVFKVIMQFLFALTPVGIFVLARRYITETFSFLAGFLFLSQTWFFEQMPALIRQEIAFIFYICGILVLFDTKLSNRVRSVLFYIFTIGLILSHYSTAYIWFILVCGGVGLSYLVRYLIPSFKSHLSVLRPHLIILPIICLLVWQVAITGTGNAIKKFVTRTDINNPTLETEAEVLTEDSATTSSPAREGGTPETQDLSLVGQIKDVVLKAFFLSTPEQSNTSIVIAEENAVKRHISPSEYTLYSESETQGYTPTIMEDRTYNKTLLPDPISKSIMVLVKIAKLLLITLFPLIGIYALYITLRRHTVLKNYDFMIFNTVAYVFIILMITIPWMQEYYNFTRLYLQMFVSLSIVAIIGGLFITERIQTFQKFILTVIVLVVYCSLVGIFDQLTGGQTRITLNKPPAIHDTFYIYEGEIAGAEWLSKYRDTHERVLADAIANLRLHSFGNISADYFGVFPRTLEKDAYVYLVNSNISLGHGFYLYQNNLLVYNYPIEFLNNHKDLVYTSGASRIYK